MDNYYSSSAGCSVTQYVTLPVTRGTAVKNLPDTERGPKSGQLGVCVARRARAVAGRAGSRTAATASRLEASNGGRCGLVARRSRMDDAGKLVGWPAATGVYEASTGDCKSPANRLHPPRGAFAGRPGRPPLPQNDPRPFLGGYRRTVSGRVKMSRGAQTEASHMGSGFDHG